MKTKLKSFVKHLIFISSAILLCTGCASTRSASTAIDQPDAKNIELFKVGIHRSMLLAEFGHPMASEVRNDAKKYEIFVFTQGYSDGAKLGRAGLHTTAGLATLGLWEIIAKPTEAFFDGNEMAYEVRYDENSLVDQVVVLKKK